MKITNKILTLAAVLASTNAKQLPQEDKHKRGKPKTDVTLTISSTKTEFAENDSILIDVTLMNNEANKPAKILDWFSPCAAGAEDDDTPTDMSFFEIMTTKSARAARYMGALFKRKDPTIKDYKILKPGEKITCEVDLGKYYEFDAPEDDDDDNEYAIMYSVDSMQLSNPSGKVVGQQLESMTSNTLTIKINSRKYVPPSSGHALRDHNHNLRQSSRGLAVPGDRITFSGGCSTAQQAGIIEAHSMALDGSIEAIDLVTAVGLAGSSTSCARYEEWFGSYDPNRHTDLQDGWERTRAAFENGNVVYDCACTHADSYAYIHRYDVPYKINLCDLFWVVGSNSKMDIIVHEMTHFDATAITDDHAYGQDDCKALAISNPLSAINNADNYALIARNPSNLVCDYPDPPPCNGDRFTLDLKTDGYPGETSWELKNMCTGIIEQSKARTSYSKMGHLYKETFCVPRAQYEFKIMDNQGLTRTGDGICCSHGWGYYAVTYEGDYQWARGNFADLDTKMFGSCVLSTGKYSSASSAVQAPSLAFDGDFSTRWESDVSIDVETESSSGLGSWLQVDLGYVSDLSKVEVTWEYASAKSYMIQVSNDNVSFTEVWKKIDGYPGMGTVVSSFGEGVVAGRYVRMQGIERATQWAYSIFEMEVYGKGSVEP